MARPASVTESEPRRERIGDRLLVQRGVFVGPSPRVNNDLYVVVASGAGHREREVLHLDAGAHAHTNTYFGRFAASYWQRWTTVTSVRVSARITTSARTRVRVMASDIAGHRRIVTAREVTADSVVTVDVPLDRFVDGGALWLEFETFAAPAVIDQVTWTVDAPTTAHNVAIAICTFNRADDCAATVAALASEDAVVAVIDAVYVVDQGTDLVCERPEYAAAASRLGSKVHYLRQPNLGGAGGFTRGLYEVSAAAPPTTGDVILMDDDILCEPETVLRLRAFANTTVEPTLVGAQMMFLLNPDYLNVGADDVDLAALAHGRAVPEALRNTSMLESNQERRVDAGYNAWWTCLIPLEVVRTIGLPLPVFFQWDDVEYGIRARSAGFVTVTLPNAAVWHADFYWKDYDDWARYFSTRNSLVVASLHSEIDGRSLARLLFRQITEHLVAMQYGLAHTTLTGIEDFLSGPAHLRDGGQQAMAAIRASRRDYPETIMHPAAGLPVPAADLRLERDRGEPSRPTAVLIKRAIDQWFGRTAPGVRAVPREDAHWWHISRFDHVVVTDASQAGMRVRRRDRTVARALLVRTLRVLRTLSRDGAQVAAQYRAAAPELISRENWARLFRQ